MNNSGKTEALIQAVNDHQIVCFKAGAGAGKTTQLISLLAHLIQQNSKTLLNSGKKIVTITYTNTAVKEIKERLSYVDSSTVIVSTIHDFLWAFIQPFQELIKKRFVELIHEGITECQNKINSQKRIGSLTSDQDLQRKITEDKDFVKDIKRLKADDIKNKYSAYIVRNNCTPSALRTYCLAYRSQQRLIEAEKDLSASPKKKVVYDPNTNIDQLYKLTFSHDSLLDIAQYVFENGTIVKKLFRDKYPFVLVDEYQDTQKSVIESLRSVIDPSQRQTPKLVFFGDPFQHIYETGINEDLDSFFSTEKYDYYRLNEDNNFRSSKAVIDCANACRDDDIKQVPQSDKTINGTVKASFVLLGDGQKEDEIIESWVKSIKSDIHPTVKKPLHVFLSTNALIAKKEGFYNLFEAMRKSQYGKNAAANFATQTMNEDETKLGDIQRCLLRLFKLVDLLDYKQPFSYLLEKGNATMTLAQAKEAIDEIRPCSDVDSLADYLSFLEGHKDNQFISSVTMQAYQSIGMKESKFSKDDFIDEVVDILSDGNDEEKELDRALFDVKFAELKSYFNYLHHHDNTPIVYQTWQSSKGREYENVALVMTDDFSIDHEYFSKLFDDGYLRNHDYTEQALLKQKLAKNLLYVGITRAKEYLNILYLTKKPLKEKFEERIGIQAENLV